MGPPARPRPHPRGADAARKDRRHGDAQRCWRLDRLPSGFTNSPAHRSRAVSRGCSNISTRSTSNTPAPASGPGTPWSHRRFRRIRDSDLRSGSRPHLKPDAPHAGPHPWRDPAHRRYAEHPGPAKPWGLPAMVQSAPLCPRCAYAPNPVPRSGCRAGIPSPAWRRSKSRTVPGRKLRQPRGQAPYR